MKGYKGMEHDMTCRGMQYKLGKSHHVDGEIELCENGSHFCENLIDVFDYYSRNDSNRFFEIEAAGDIKTDGKKSVSSDMTILRELSEIEVNRCYYSDSGYGNGNGNGYGSGYGYGYGNGNGNGNGYGSNVDAYKIMKFI